MTLQLHSSLGDLSLILPPPPLHEHSVQRTLGRMKKKSWRPHRHPRTITTGPRSTSPMRLPNVCAGLAQWRRSISQCARQADQPTFCGRAIVAVSRNNQSLPISVREIGSRFLWGSALGSGLSEENVEVAWIFILGWIVAGSADYLHVRMHSLAEEWREKKLEQGDTQEVVWKRKWFNAVESMDTIHCQEPLDSPHRLWPTGCSRMWPRQWPLSYLGISRDPAQHLLGTVLVAEDRKRFDCFFLFIFIRWHE